ncbi:Eco57I restriction-modification methylase domain-containing protein [Thermobrachium celere]|uniref:site-specific DNA-methyltransferase (adenine-specific) n=1 Tax=Thermobrachium celere DSM 8682 TaxID=941824 RepID=R7RSW4_9CLOT|nr:N-6 DNA methylase [Thermobrachium celere]CDF58378.1 Modification methylase bstVI [Thermobrachium celere DSM 8682]
MLKEFITDLKETFEAVLLGEDKLENFIVKWGINNYIGEFYERIKNIEEKKTTGSFYTPKVIVDYITQGLADEINNLKDVRILDPSCGGGYFLMGMYNALLEKGFDKEEIINSLYGYDIDENAVMITMLELYRLSGVIPKNVIKKDFLFEDNLNYNYIVGNPPYVGHKMIDKDYRAKLKDKYIDVFSDKADLSYCFIKRSVDALKDNGRLIFFTSRYMLEALNGEGIREYLLKHGSIEAIVDFYGVRVIKGVGVDNIILNFVKSKEFESVKYFRLNKDAKHKGQDVFEDIKKGDKKYHIFFRVDKKNLKKDGWIFQDELGFNILNKINGVELGIICSSFQGIITGCDRAFILNREEIEKYNIEKELVRRWIKSSHIDKFKVGSTQEFIIYSDMIKNEEQYKNAIEYISIYKEKLLQRRECKKGVRRWFELQWGRNREDFEGRKIIYPYKSNTNRFAIDEGSFYSADVYSLKINDMFKEVYSYEFIVGVLNSTIYEFYIKTMAKKLGDDLYEYYPNKILKLKIPNYIKEVEDIVKSNRDTKEKIKDIDNILCEYFGIECHPSEM